MILESECQVSSIASYDDIEHSNVKKNEKWNINVKLTNGNEYGCDVVICAIGVKPYLPWIPNEIKKSEDGGIAVDENMETNVREIYAAGDACTVEWAEISQHWFQMRLWTQVISLKYLNENLI